MESITKFDELIQLALAQELVGWDFAWLNARTREEPLPWDYRTIVLKRMEGTGSLLDLGTGGGEFLASLAPFPPVAWATEGYPPNVPVARARLEPLGVRVADTSADQEGALPFADASFDLVFNRHEGLRWSEVTRVLKQQGRFITQQVGGENCMELNRFLQDEPNFIYSDWTLEQAVRTFEEAGLRVVWAQEAFPRWTFLDVAGVVFFLKVISWQIDDFSVERYREGLLRIHQIIEKEGGFTVHEHRFIVEADRK